jgi:hypothetical protein
MEQIVFSSEDGGSLFLSMGPHADYRTYERTFSSSSSCLNRKEGDFNSIWSRYFFFFFSFGSFIASIFLKSKLKHFYSPPHDGEDSFP